MSPSSPIGSSNDSGLDTYSSLSDSFLCTSVMCRTIFSSSVCSIFLNLSLYILPIDGSDSPWYYVPRENGKGFLSGLRLCYFIVASALRNLSSSFRCFSNVRCCLSQQLPHWAVLQALRLVTHKGKIPWRITSLGREPPLEMGGVLCICICYFPSLTILIRVFCAFLPLDERENA